MTEKTLGVVLSTTPYNDRTQFVHIYTQTFGKITCKVSIARTKRGSRQNLMYAPLSVVELELEGRSRQEILTIGEASLIESPYLFIAGEPEKTAQCMYMAELLDKTILESYAPDPKIWQLIARSIEALQQSSEGSANFHLVFTTRLCHLLGFSVDVAAWHKGMLFDIREGEFTAGPIYHACYLNAESAEWLYRLLITRFDALEELRLNHQQRNILLDMMLTFIRIHLPDAANLKTVEVLKLLYQ